MTSHMTLKVHIFIYHTTSVEVRSIGTKLSNNQKWGYKSLTNDILKKKIKINVIMVSSHDKSCILKVQALSSEQSYLDV
jgi:hypothetical protein